MKKNAVFGRLVQELNESWNQHILDNAHVA